MGRLKRILDMLLKPYPHLGGSVSGPVPEMFPRSDRITGSFDRVEVDYKLPIKESVEKEWQTQDFDCDNELYLLADDGWLYEVIGDDRAYPLKFSGYMQIINVIQKSDGKNVYVKVELALTAGKVDGITRIQYDHANTYGIGHPNTEGKYF